jgi:hypothetical protein
MGILRGKSGVRGRQLQMARQRVECTLLLTFWLVENACSSIIIRGSVAAEESSYTKR